VVQPEPTRVKNNILPTIIGAILGAAIVNGVSNNQYNNCNDQRFAIRQHYYQNQLEIERLQLLQMQVEILERQQYESI
jgi:glycerol uptake facilitator-like aquaporin